MAKEQEKENLVGLAWALQIPEKGTVADLSDCIKAHLTDNPSLAENPQFSGLFSSRRLNHHTPRALSQASTPTSQIAPIPPIPGPSSLAPQQVMPPGPPIQVVLPPGPPQYPLSSYQYPGPVSHYYYTYSSHPSGHSL
jgi:hypothetical protein